MTTVELESRVASIGRILGVRWVASSARTLKAVWDSYEPLYRHFELAAVDEQRDDAMRKKYKGLAMRFTCHSFILDLGLLYDALKELANLSLMLQSTTITIPQALDAINRTIRVLASFKEFPGEMLEEANDAVKVGVFHNVPLHENAKMKSINGKQFLQSLVDNMRQRMCTFANESSAKLISDMKVLYPDNWPQHVNIRHGEQEIRRLCHRFALNEQQCLNGMRAYTEDRQHIPQDLQPILRCIDTIPCSTAECERNFSLMNDILTDTRSSLLVDTVSNLMFTHLNGPPISKWNALPYVESWLVSHRSSADTRSKRITIVDKEDSQRECLWSIL
jgi:hypothetical protein